MTERIEEKKQKTSRVISDIERNRNFRGEKQRKKFDDTNRKERKKVVKGKEMKREIKQDIFREEKQGK